MLVDIYLAVSRLDRYPPLFTSNSVNNCKVLQYFTLPFSTTSSLPGAFDFNKKISQKGFHIKEPFAITHSFHIMGARVNSSALFTSNLRKSGRRLKERDRLLTRRMIR